MVLCLTAYFAALAAQIVLSFYQSGTVLRELDDQMGNFNAISRFQNGVERSLTALDDYRWEYGDTDALLAELDSAFSVTNAWLWRINGSLDTVSEEQYLLYSAVCTTYDSYTALVEELRAEIAAGQDAAAAQLYYEKVSPCGGYLRQYAQQLLNTAISDAQSTYTTVSALSSQEVSCFLLFVGNFVFVFAKLAFDDFLYQIDGYVHIVAYLLGTDDISFYRNGNLNFLSFFLYT